MVKTKSPTSGAFLIHQLKKRMQILKELLAKQIVELISNYFRHGYNPSIASITNTTGNGRCNFAPSLPPRKCSGNLRSATQSEACEAQRSVRKGRATSGKKESRSEQNNFFLTKK